MALALIVRRVMDTIAAINIRFGGRKPFGRELDPPQRLGVRLPLACSHPAITDPVWNHFKRRFFLLHPVARFTIGGAVSTRGLPTLMIVCSCNVISDRDVREIVNAADEALRHAKQVYGCLGCSAECGRCARTIKTIIEEALGPSARACRDGCLHSLTADGSSEDEFALAAS